VELVSAYQSEDGKTELLHADGVPWWDAPLPRRWHRCRVQTQGWHDYIHLAERCACGAIRLERGEWQQRNERRHRGR
jgi:hypothetical protein